jgi:hypothetical protein
MLRHVSWVASLALIGLVSACSSAARAPGQGQGRTARAPEPPEPESSEWLYATRGFGGDLKSECKFVQQAIEAEQGCRAGACVYAERLARDWVRRCDGVMPEKADEVKSLASKFELEKDGERYPCLEEIKPILDDGCGRDEACAPKVQSWTVRCSGVVGSPLVVNILESRVESQLGDRRVKLDRRNCDTITEELFEARHCKPGFECEGFLPLVDEFRKNCVAPGSSPSFKQAVAEMVIRAGAGQTPGPIEIAPRGSELSPADYPVPLADGSGIILWVCGTTPTSLKHYLELRERCRDGDVVVIRRSGSRTEGTVRFGRAPHPDDPTFLSLYPSLIAMGETETRVQAGLDRLVDALKDAVVALPSAGMPYKPESAAALIRALDAESFAVRHAGPQPPQLKHRDAELIELFRALGEWKRQVAELQRPENFTPFMWRSMRRPLADLAPNGSVAFGADNPASSVDIGKLFPQAMSAYLTQLRTFTVKVRRYPLNEWQVKTWTKIWNDASSQCRNVESRVAEHEQQLLECAFSRDCENERLTELVEMLGRARRDTIGAYRHFTLAASTLEDVPATPASEQRCLEPWW